MQDTDVSMQQQPDTRISILKIYCIGVEIPRIIE
jgi:hypothetical protein